MSIPQVIRAARPEEAPQLTDLALRSKAHWGYSKEFMDSCRAELTVDSARVLSERYQYFVAVDEDSIVGFYALKCASGGSYELEALFVEPGHIGTGIGRALIQHAKRTLSGLGATRLIIQGDPHAADFYVAAGGRRIGDRESDSIPGRHLPVFEIPIDPL